eukprot:jgi/Psemu1/233922/estExt_Genewise1.C_80180
MATKEEDEMTEHDFSEREMEISFFEKDGSYKQITAGGSYSRKNSIDESVYFLDESVQSYPNSPLKPTKPDSKVHVPEKTIHEIDDNPEQDDREKGGLQECEEEQNSTDEKQQQQLSTTGLVDEKSGETSNELETDAPSEKKDEKCDEEQDRGQQKPAEMEDVPSSEECNDQQQTDDDVDNGDDDCSPATLPEPKLRTKSGRVVKPVRRLVDGFETSIGEYGRSDEDIDDKEDDTETKNDSECIVQPANDSDETHDAQPDTDCEEDRAVSEDTAMAEESKNVVHVQTADDSPEETSIPQQETSRETEIIQDEGIAKSDESKNVVPNKQSNNLQLASESEISCDKETPTVTAIATANGPTDLDTLSHVSTEEDRKKVAEETIDHSPTALENTGNADGEKSAFVKKVRTTASHLYSLNEDALYESEEVNTVREDNRNQPKETAEKTFFPKLSLEPLSFVQNLEYSGFKDRKKIVKMVVTKLTGFDVEVREKSSKVDLFDPSDGYPIADSIFDKQMENVADSSSWSSLSSPPEVDLCLRIGDGEDQIRSKSNDDTDNIFPIFDFIPVKGEISQESNANEKSKEFQPIIHTGSSKEYSRPHKRLRQGSTCSQNGSLDSLSTQPKSSKSATFFRRSSRRLLRKQGSSRLSLSQCNTQSTKSPHMTPIEIRSLVDDKQQIEAPVVDHGGQMVGWDTDMEAYFPSVPDTEEMTEALDRSDLFHETLAAFSSVEDINFLKDFSLSKSTKVPKATSSLMWRQLIANWKHSESCKAMLTRPSSIQPSELKKHVGFFETEDDFSSSISTVQFQFDSGNVVFSNDFVPAHSYSLLRCTDVDRSDVDDESFLVLTRYLCDIGPGSSSFEGERSCHAEDILRHNIRVPDTLERKDNESIPTITDIHREAKSHLPSLEKIINCIVNYSTQNEPSSNDLECNELTSTSGVKDYKSIRSKAIRKYNGDALQVKDALRGEITFPDEASLICGLYSLHNLAGGKFQQKENGRTDLIPSFQIVRLKNLFRTTCVGNEIYNALPTGYRHILINLKLECGLIAELQFQIAQLFDVMGTEGYLLHQDLVALEMENRKHHVSSASETVFDVSSSGFIHSILSLPANLGTISEDRQSFREITQDESVMSNSLMDEIARAQDLEDSDDSSSQSESTEEERPKVPAVGIAALAAQAALKKPKNQVNEGEGKKPPVGGIAVLAADAALKKSEKQANEQKIPAGAIAALAAEAALKKSENHANKQKAPAGGIAALAAEAALKKSEKHANEQKASVGGIAALAAEAALKKSEKQANKQKSPIGGIAALAAEAALKKSEKQANGQKTPIGGIAALAAEAALKKSAEQSNQEKKEISPIDAPSMITLISAVFQAGVDEAISNPRDVPALYCLHLLASAFKKLLKQLSCNMAAEKDWVNASDVLCSLLLRCEQNLPRCHPTTLGSMMDLAGALTEAHSFDTARSIISQTFDLLSSYLSEAESLFFDRRLFDVFQQNDRDRVVVFDDRVDAIGIMQAFCNKLHEDLSRDFLKFLGRNHRITLLNHSLVADSFSVLANCLSASVEVNSNNNVGSFDSSRSINGTPSQYYWALAHSQYDIALRGWIRVESLIHPNAACVAFSIARCLRELGKTKQAIKLLETLASCLEQQLDDEIATRKTNPHATAKSTTAAATTTTTATTASATGFKTFIVPLNDEKQSSSSYKDSGPSFISRRRNNSMPMPMSISNPTQTILENHPVASYEREQTAVLCFWMMAVLSAEDSPDERGRSRALSLLHTASLTLQRVLSKDRNTESHGCSYPVLDDQTRLMCLDLYQKIEGEALDLFEPLQRIPLVKNYIPKTNNNATATATATASNEAAPPRKQMAPWDILTPMRQKRQWISPRSRIKQTGSASVAAATYEASDSTAGNLAANRANETSESAFF